eukprot:TRINITY_DN30277_c0_g1_i1.p1 TRINITY_DN30277_c0_g1~~TRINITY_DN30277_c0_g1_i1.p1  ORF type:complete len:788 (+),score=318.74 TRINITY_DN30277_c0_g1_i1:64-2364(+)
MAMESTRASMGNNDHLETISTSTGVPRNHSNPPMPLLPEGLGEEHVVRVPPPPQAKTRFESIDYDHESSLDMMKRAQIEPSCMGDTVVPWVLSLLTAGIIALTNYAIVVGVSLIHDLKYDTVQEALDKHGTSTAYAYSVLFWLSLAAVATAVCYAAPGAVGSGIPQVKAFLNGVRIPESFSLATFLAKVVGMIACLGIGFPAGREGPMVHIGACIGAGISRGYSKKLCGVLAGERMRLWGNMDTPERRRDYVVIGSVCGVAVAFGAPIGAILFALEEVSSYWSPALTFQTFVSACVGGYIIGILISGTSVHNEGWVLFGSHGPTHEFAAWEIPLFAAVAAGGGLIGTLYNYIHIQMCKWRKVVVKGDKTRRVVEAFIMIFITMSVFFWLPTFYGCEDVPETSEFNKSGIHVVHLTCEKGVQYNQMATLAHSPQERLLFQLFSRETQEYFKPEVLGVFLFVYFALASTIFGIAVPVGAFIPAMTIGAVWGRLSGELLHGALKDVDPGLYALVGAASGLGGTTRMTISLASIMVEITNDIDTLLPIMMACVIGKAIGDRFTESIYALALKNTGVIFLPSSMPKRIVRQTVKDVMTQQPHVLPKIARYADIQHALTTNQNAFPVVNDRDDMVFVGVICQAQLQDALAAARATLAGEDATYGDKEIDIDPGVLLDLRNYMNLSPFFVLESAPLKQAYRLFRFLGLRQLCVVNQAHQAVGILTRTNLNPDTLPLTTSLTSQYHQYPCIYSHTEEIVRMHRRNSTYLLYEKP